MAMEGRKARCSKHYRPPQEEIKVAYYGYIRVSTETQAEKGGGLEVQRQAIEKYASDNGITIEQIFCDAGISGAAKDTEIMQEEAIGKRNGLMALLAKVGKGDTIIVLNTSRLWRSDVTKVLIRGELKKHGVILRSIEQPNFDIYAANPNNRFMETVFEAMDEWDRASIALKLAKGRAVKAQRGDKPAGMCPFGYQYTEDKKHVVINPDEGKVVKLMFTEAQKGRSLQQIADTLNAKGYKSRRGNDWVRGSVGAILNNRFYIGELTHQGETIQGTHEPLISKIQFGKVAASLTRRHR